MNTRRALVLGVTITAFAGLVLAAVPFISFMSPSLKAKADVKLRVELNEIPENSALEVDWHVYKVFLVRKPSPTAFLMPYMNGSYMLPDPTWERAYISCELFSVGSKGFSCVDPKLPDGWRENAQWDLAGNSKSDWMPDLQRAPYKIKGNSIVLSPEYK